MTGFARMQKQLVAAVRDSMSGGSPKIPEAGRLFWGWFLELSATRASGGFGPLPIQHSEIEAFARLNNWPIEPRHVGLLLEMDRALLSSMGTRETRPAATVRPSADLTPDIFDAVIG